MTLSYMRWTLMFGVIAGAFIQGGAAVARADGSASMASAEPQAENSDGTRRAGVEEIIVTARRSSESLIKVPVAVTALSSDTLVRNNVTTLESAAELVPFVTLSRFVANNGALLSIRGIGSTPNDVGVQQSVLVNFDNVLIGRGRLIQQGLYDLAQMEVLKGPQALFYGKNSPAGVISITTADPGNELGGYVRAGYEFVANERYVEGAIGGPVADTLRVRLAGRYAKMRGFIYNDAQAQPYPAAAVFDPWRNAGATLPGASERWGPNTEDLGLRLTTIWEPSPDLSFKLKYSFGRAKNHGDDELYINWCGLGRTNLAAYGVDDPNTDCAFDRHISTSDLPALLTANMADANNGVPYGRMNTHIVSLNTNWQINDDLSIAAITGYYNLDNKTASVPNQTSYAGLYAISREKSWQISQELRLSSDYDGPVNFVLGGYIDRQSLKASSTTTLAPLPIDAATGRYYTYDRFVDLVSTSESVFGQILWDITDQVELTGGVRYTHDRRDSLDGLTYVHPAFSAFLRPVGDFFDRVYDGSDYSPEVTLSWRPDSYKTFYVAYKTGYKSGGFSYPGILIPSFNEQNTHFLPETVEGFEVGFKGQLLDNRLRLEFAAYRTDYSNQQLSSFDATLLSFIVTNAGKSRTQGFELQASYVPVEGLNLRGALGYNDGKYRSYVGAPCVNGSPAGCTADFSGKRLPRAPKWGGNFGATYEMPIGSDFKLGLNGDAFYSGSYFASDNLDPNQIQDSFWKLNAGISLGAINDRWKLSLIGRNLTNKFIKTFSLDSARGAVGDYTAVPTRPREFALEGRVEF